MTWRYPETSAEMEDLIKLDLQENLRKDSALILELDKPTKPDEGEEIITFYYDEEELYDETYSGKHRLLIWITTGEATEYVYYEIEE